MILTFHKNRLFRQFQVFFSWLPFAPIAFAQILDAKPLAGVIVGPDKRPIKGAKIDFVPLRFEFQLPDDLVPRASVTSDESGVFPIPLHPSNELVIIAYAPGFRRARFAFADLPRGYTKVGLTLDRGENIEGQVLDAVTGQPIADAAIGPVVLSPDEEVALANKHVPVWTASGPDGRFRIEGLMPKRSFQFLVRKEGYQLENAQTKASNQNLIVRLKKGGSRISGVVASPSSPPENFAHSRLLLNGNGFNFITKADEKGRFVYEGLPPGNFSLEALVEHPRVSRVELLEFPRDNGKEVRILVSEGYWLIGTVYDATTSAPAAGVVLRVEDKVTTSGADGSFRVGPLWLVGKPSIEVSEESGYMIASTAPPGAFVQHGETDGFRNIEGETVWVRPIRQVRVNLSGYELTTQPVQVVFVGEDGSRVAERMTSQSQVIRLKTEVGGVLWCTDHKAWASSLAFITKKPARPTLALSLTLHPAASVDGRVVRSQDPNTSPSRPTVRIVPDNVSSSKLDNMPSLFEATTTVDGRFRFPCLPDGNYSLIATSSSGKVERSRKLSLGVGQHVFVEIELPAGKRFAGSVIDEKKQKLAGVAVRYYVRKADGSTEAGLVETDAQGQFEVRELDGDALSLVQVERKGYVTWEQREIPLPCDNLEVVLKPEAALPFVVQASPAKTWDVHLMKIDLWGSGTYAKQLLGREISSARVVGGTQDAFPSPPQGRYRLVAVSSDGGRMVGVSDEVDWDPSKEAPRPVVVIPGKTGQLRLEFENATIDQGEVVATNMILPESLSAAEYKMSNVQGDSVVLSDLLPGDYLVICTSPSFNASAINVRVEAERMATVKLRSMQLGTIEGRVLERQIPLPQVRITVKSQTDPTFPPKVAETDETGSFRVESLPADSYVVEAELATGEETSRRVRKGTTIPQEGGVVQVDLDFAPPPRISFSLPPSMAVSPGAEIILLSRDTGETVRCQWRNGLFEANLQPGVYSVSVGDAPLGTIRIEADGHVEPVQ